MNINTPSYWDNVWKKDRGDTRQYPEVQDRILQWIHLHSDTHQNPRIVDLGCGAGVLLEKIQRNFSTAHLTGVDFSQVSIDNLDGIDGVVADIAAPCSYRVSADIAIATEVLEHINDDAALVRSMFDIADTIFVSVPNNCLPPEEEPEHVRTYTGQQLKSLLTISNDIDCEVIEAGWQLVARASKRPLIEKKQKVYIAILNQGTIRPELANLLIHITHDPRYQIKIIYPSERPITNNRNKIVRDFIYGDWDYLLMIDSDVVSHRSPLDLIELDKDVVGYPCPQWNEGNIYWLAMDQDDDGYKSIQPERRHGLQRVDAIGTGCILIKRQVLEHVHAPFSDRLGEDGTLDLGEDFYFCQKAIEAGFEVWCDWRAPCSHFKELDLINVLELVTNG